MVNYFTGFHVMMRSVSKTRKGKIGKKANPFYNKCDVHKLTWGKYSAFSVFEPFLCFAGMSSVFSLRFWVSWATFFWICLFSGQMFFGIRFLECWCRQVSTVYINSVFGFYVFRKSIFFFFFFLEVWVLVNLDDINGVI